MTVDPLSLGILERLEKYPDSFTDDDLREIAGWYEGQKTSGVWGSFPIKAGLILDEREKNRYTKEEK